jgi:predicted amidohydrolase
MTKMNVTVVQTDIVWEDKKANITKLEKCLNELKGTTDIAILPEMFATGFSMNCEAVAEPIDGEVMHALQRLAQSTGIAHWWEASTVKSKESTSTAPSSSHHRTSAISTTSATCSAWEKKRTISVRAANN